MSAAIRSALTEALPELPVAIAVVHPAKAGIRTKGTKRFMTALGKRVIEYGGSYGVGAPKRNCMRRGEPDAGITTTKMWSYSASVIAGTAVPLSACTISGTVLL
jgi:hypothetical protein